jgi:hypothetical protein
MPTGRDFGKLLPSTQAELRRVAANMVLSGANRIDVASAIDVDRRSVGEWVRAFEGAGEAVWTGGLCGVGRANKRPWAGVRKRRCAV